MKREDTDQSQTLDRFLGCLLGLALGDALGTTLEFAPRGTFEVLTDMVGGGPFHLRPGQETDDTSMALCLASSLVEKRAFDPADQMDRYCRWWKEGYLSCTGSCFDIGGTTAGALSRFLKTRDPFSGSTDPHSAGNGSLMRLAPIPMWFDPDADLASRYAMESSRTTHGALECLDACSLFSQLLVHALSGVSKDELLFQSVQSCKGVPTISAIARGDYRKKNESEIHASGYVVHTLEAAENTDICDVMYDGDPPDPDAQQKLDFSKTLAFTNFTLEKNSLRYEYSDIDIPPSDMLALQNPENDYFTLFEFSAKFDPVPTMLTQDHVNVIKGFLGQTTGFKKELIKTSVIIMAEKAGTDQVRYLHGNYGRGTFTFYGGHDPEDYQHAVGDPPTDLSLHKNSPGYRLILNNILFPAARKKPQKT
jgi:ADP-ribosyl-[dinitrogen reductase] hydrolase